MASKNQQVHTIIHVAAAAAAAAGAGLAQFPTTDVPILCSIQAVMISEIGEIHDQKVSKGAALSLLGIFAATTGGRAISQWLVGWIPVWGNTINATTAASLTEAIGWAADSYFCGKTVINKKAA